ncbi:Transaldolase [Rosistilla carotiformis]|uniref:Transaldolase n=1 Tax=Rosistilla carotiformis TaxID=2528017 RepID=A0A518JPL0_9BACT|nr:transaldolase family protein [Rosistilla carotiformis]QDV67486.1 Transaldolase [Rosistilla carotiformis]
MTTKTDREGAITETILPHTEQSKQIAESIRRDIRWRGPAPETTEDPFWQRTNPTNTQLWLDSGDLEAIGDLWNSQFSGLTTNNSLLNAEVQNGTYDHFIPEAAKLLPGISESARVREIAFILNLRHALKLVERFRCRVSVELHTDVANDVEATLAYARRCHELCPEYFLVKVPLTPAGLVAIKQLSDEGIRVNCTLGFSARQNYVATAFARPAYVNVFLGRLNSYIAENDLGDGEWVGEKTTLASQAAVASCETGNGDERTQQIAASLRDAEQLQRLAGVDVITMPTKVALQAKDVLEEPWRSQLDQHYEVKLHQGVDPSLVGVEKLWEISDLERQFVENAAKASSLSPLQLQQLAMDHGVDDLFPTMSEQQRQAIADQGKVPVHQHWQEGIRDGSLAIDSLMTLAGLASFAAAQAELDQRIRDQLA